MPISDNPSFYQTGGTLSADAPSYVVRQADSDLLEGLRQGEFCYVLNARQTFNALCCKSPLLYRVQNGIEERTASSRSRFTLRQRHKKTAIAQTLTRANLRVIIVLMNTDIPACIRRNNRPVAVWPRCCGAPSLRAVSYEENGFEHRFVFQQ